MSLIYKAKKIVQALNIDKSKLLTLWYEKNASILDYPREELDKEVWNISGDTVKLQNNIKEEIEDIVYSAIDDLDLPDNAVKDVFIYGSILTNQYNPKTDIDARIVLDPEIVSERFPEGTTGDKLFDVVQGVIHGVLLEPTQHPFNATLVIEGEQTELGQDPLGKTADDPVYDVLNDIMVVNPVHVEDYDPDEKYSVEREETDIIMEKLDGLIRETKTDTIDFLTIKDAVGEIKEKDKFVRKMEEKLLELESDIEALVGEYDEIKDKRTDAYQTGEGHEDPDQIKFKYLERYKYIDVLRKLKVIFKGGISEDEVDDIEEVIV